MLLCFFHCFFFSFLFQEGASACEEETGDGVTWPKTPAGNTVIIQTCPPGRTGYLSRTCDPDSEWQPVFSSCINIELNKVVDSAEVSVALLLVVICNF